MITVMVLLLSAHLVQMKTVKFVLQDTFDVHMPMLINVLDLMQYVMVKMTVIHHLKLE